MIRRLRPDLEVGLLRGNVNTRLAKIERGEVGATLLALAGLKRLGFEHHVTRVLDTDEFLPAVGQGAIAITVRAGDGRAREAVARIADAATGIALAAERAFLRVLDGSCRTPIAGHARVTEGAIALRGIVLRPDGSQSIETAMSGTPGDAQRLGTEAGRDVKDRMPPGFFSA
jgi:hydroxymethylbilane synthase